MQHHQNTELYGSSSSNNNSEYPIGGLIFPEVSSSHSQRFPWSSLPYSTVHDQNNPYGGFFNRRSAMVVEPGGSFGGMMMNAQEMMDAKALAASKNHSEAERRRRERINNHLAKLRSLLPSTTKTDKASLLAEVIQHVKDLKRLTSMIDETSAVPTEMDELTVNTSSEDTADGKLVIKASLSCEDRSDLLPDLIRTLKSLRLRTLKAEITTLGGRVKNVLFITGDDDLCEENHHFQQKQQCCVSSIQEALKAVMEKTASERESSSGNAKRQRTNINVRA